MSKLLSALAALSICVSATPCAWAHDQQQAIEAGGLQRIFTLFVPDKLVNVGHRVPIVVVLHGGLETGAIIRQQMRMDGCGRGA
jgi:poly(3-hydroxybutyrate) depolymerase